MMHMGCQEARWKGGRIYRTEHVCGNWDHEGRSGVGTTYGAVSDQRKTYEKAQQKDLDTKIVRRALQP